jgi:hypothetical protein
MFDFVPEEIETQLTDVGGSQSSDPHTYQLLAAAKMSKKHTCIES